MQLCLFFGILCGILFHPASGLGCDPLSDEEFEVKANEFCSDEDDDDDEDADSCSDIENWNVSMVTDMSGAFSNCDPISTANLTKWSTSEVFSMRAMFYKSAHFEGVGIQHWDTRKVKDFSSMFEAVPSLGNVNLTSWDTSRAVHMEKMFYQCHGTQIENGLCDDMEFEGIGLPTWNTSNVVTFQHMFQRSHGFVANLSGWNMSKATSINRMFAATPSSNPTKTKTWSLCNLELSDGVLERLNTTTCGDRELGEMQIHYDDCSKNLPKYENYRLGECLTKGQVFFRALPPKAQQILRLLPPERRAFARDWAQNRTYRPVPFPTPGDPDAGSNVSRWARWAWVAIKDLYEDHPSVAI